MRTRNVSLLIVLISVIVVVSAQACSKLDGISSTLQPTSLVLETTTHDNIERIYGIYEPASLTPNNAPLVFLLHGGGGAAQQIFDTEYGQNWRQLADEHGFLLVVPQGREDTNSPGDHHWNDCRTGILNPNVNTQLDDVGFIVSIIDLMVSRFGLDRTRVYSTGASNGGMMSFRLGYEASEHFAAIGAVIANIPDPHECQLPTTPLSVLIMNGTADPLMPYGGGCVANNNCLRGRVISTDASVQFWVDFNGTNSEPIVEDLPDLDPADGSKITTSLYENGQDNTEVVLFRIDGGGHTVPGEAPIGLAQRLVSGPKNHDINGAVETWKFFEDKGR